MTKIASFPSEALLYFSFAYAFSSFIGVLVFRIPTGKSINGRSICDECGTIIKWWSNFPILSWIVLRGKCSKCGAEIPRLIWYIEIFAIVLFSVLWLRHSSFEEMVIWFGYIVFGMALSIIDFKHLRLPNALTLPFFLFTFSTIVVAKFLQNNPAALPTALLGSLLNGAFYFVLRLVSRGGLGLGDVKLAPTIGLIAGEESLMNLVYSTYLTFLLAGLVAVVMLIARKASRKTPLPLGPFMLAAPFLIYILN
jgi:leader peptidase (prepilin peptidase)/N-methyltransferase